LIYVIGRVVEDTGAGDGVSIKTPRGRQRETTSSFSYKNMASQIRNNANDVNGGNRRMRN